MKLAILKMHRSSVMVLISQVVVISCVVQMIITSPIDMTEDKRSSSPEQISDDYADYHIGVRYDEYPTIVPKKRTALLVNRIMVALKDALEQEERERTGLMGDSYAAGKKKLYSSDDVRTMDLQRRGHQSLANGQNKGRIYWRCYFNAVTCF